MNSTRNKKFKALIKSEKSRPAGRARSFSNASAKLNPTSTKKLEKSERQPAAIPSLANPTNGDGNGRYSKFDFTSLSASPETFVVRSTSLPTLASLAPSPIPPLPRPSTAFVDTANLSRSGTSGSRHISPVTWRAPFAGTISLRPPPPQFVSSMNYLPPQSAILHLNQPIPNIPFDPLWTPPPPHVFFDGPSFDPSQTSSVHLHPFHGNAHIGYASVANKRVDDMAVDGESGPASGALVGYEQTGHLLDSGFEEDVRLFGLAASADAAGDGDGISGAATAGIVGVGFTASDLAHSSVDDILASSDGFADILDGLFAAN
ncbi:hypothetical protein HDU82_008098 [Entophlyctis luteolus]|nr:hypothetical protein HDU82_008098 [Entophlyctis luteolus]